MDLSEFRKSRGLSQEGCARALGLTSKSYICEIEGGKRPSLKLALKIEQWSGGEVSAASLNPDAAEVANQAPAPEATSGEAA